MMLNLLSWLMMLFSLLIPSLSAQARPDWVCTRVESLVLVDFVATFEFFIYNNISVLYQNTECRKCNLIAMTTLNKNEERLSFEGSKPLDGHFSYHFQVNSIDLTSGETQVMCEKFLYDGFGECGRFNLDISECKMTVIQAPKNQYIGLYIGIPLIIVIILVFNLVEKYSTRIRKSIDELIQRSVFRDFNRKVHPIIELDEAAFSTSKLTTNSTKTPDNDSQQKPRGTPEKMRYISLDVFRGLSIICMIFVTYGYATYKFFYHVVWASFNLSTLVMPWFIWIMGVSIPVALNSILTKPNANRARILAKIVWRSVKLFAIGLVLNIDYDWQWSSIRYFGVLQRIALSYFVLALVELIFWKKIDLENYITNNSWKYYIADLIYSVPHTIVVLVILTIWYLVVYLLPVPGCPTGYFGAGGLADGGKWPNCTGGATGYVDLMVLGKTHLYPYPTQKIIYDTNDYEPEGIMGTLTSIVLAYFGVIAGRVLLFYPNRMRHFYTFLVWFLVTFVLFGALTQFDMEEGLEPVVKNVWTFSFTLLSATTSLFVLAVLYFLIDIKQLWNGNPFVYVGCNSLFIYTCHYLFLFQFPVQWKMPNFHLEKFLMCIWGSTFWSLIAAYLYYKRTFFNI